METILTEGLRLGLPIAESGFEDHLRDESRFRGVASAIVRAGHERHVVDLMRLADKHEVLVTVAAGRTSLTGASVPVGGIVLDLAGLDWIDPDDLTRVGPGVIVKNYRSVVSERGLFYPPDPTSEDSCTLGGNVACNASGALSYLYGPTRKYIRGLRVVLPDGRVLNVERGEVLSEKGVFRIPPDIVEPRPDRELCIPAPRLKATSWDECKNVAGLYSSDPMDLVDLFIGSEGILCVVVELRTVLRPRRQPCFALMVYVPDRERVVELVELLDRLRRMHLSAHDGSEREINRVLGRHGLKGETATYERFRNIVPACMEWFGRSCSGFLSDKRAARVSDCYGALYVEQEYDESEDPLEIATQWADLLDLLNRSPSAQSKPTEAEVALDAKQIRNLREERHRVPTRLNESIPRGMVKTATDFSVPLKHLESILKLYDESLPAGRSYVFGHIGNGHLHTNILSKDTQEQQAARALYLRLAREVCDMGGSVSAEHGIGKLKQQALEIMIGTAGIEEIRRVKNSMDPHWILNSGNMIPPSG
jgi:D-lactate dehydrogenase (cytochrome)